MGLAAERRLDAGPVEHGVEPVIAPALGEPAQQLGQ
jgi:hypothetical protein